MSLMSFIKKTKNSLLNISMLVTNRDKVKHLPLHRPSWFMGGMGLKNVPAIPIEADGLFETGEMLVKRKEGVARAKEGLKQNEFTINGQTASGYDFMFHGGFVSQVIESILSISREIKSKPSKILGLLYDAIHSPKEEEVQSNLSLDDPSQWAMSWTTYKDNYQDSLPHLEGWMSSLTDKQSATDQFWPMIANNGLGYNLLVLQKVNADNITRLKAEFKQWSDTHTQAYEEGRLYVIDLKIFANCTVQKVGNTERSVPSTTTYLAADPVSKELKPFAIRVSCSSSPSEYYTPENDAWLYALQAAKTSVTVYGIWLGHVYHWHIVTGAMLMTMFNTMSSEHPVYRILQPQSNYLIQFDEILFLAWREIAPPTAITRTKLFLQLINDFATNRTFFDDDPKTTLEKFGIRETDFSVQTSWDKYPVVKDFLYVWDATEEYVTAFVNQNYKDDQDVVNDTRLKEWIKKSSNPKKGNVQGLPKMNSKSNLIRVLTSIIYRITMHGSSYINRSINPSHTFVANFPPCLQKTTVPSANTKISTSELLQYLPNTDTIGKMVDFYYTFSFGEATESFIPENGINSNLFFPGGENSPENQALIAYRQKISDFISNYDQQSTKSQWPRGVDT